jgi:hypothetical protein
MPPWRGLVHEPLRAAMRAAEGCLVLKRSEARRRAVA